MSRAFHHGEATLPDGWVMRRVRLDGRGVDVNGWVWGAGHPVWYLSPRGVDDSLTVRAPCPVIAVSLLTVGGWPPRSVKRYNWEYQTP